MFNEYQKGCSCGGFLKSHCYIINNTALVTDIKCIECCNKKFYNDIDWIYCMKENENEIRPKYHTTTITYNKLVKWMKKIFE